VRRLQLVLLPRTLLRFPIQAPSQWVSELYLPYGRFRMNSQLTLEQKRSRVPIRQDCHHEMRSLSCAPMNGPYRTTRPPARSCKSISKSSLLKSAGKSPSTNCETIENR